MLLGQHCQLNNDALYIITPPAIQLTLKEKFLEKTKKKREKVLKKKDKPMKLKPLLSKRSITLRAKGNVVISLKSAITQPFNLFLLIFMIQKPLQLLQTSTSKLSHYLRRKCRSKFQNHCQIFKTLTQNHRFWPFILVSRNNVSFGLSENHGNKERKEGVF